jgi:hypothetical protein
MSWQCPKCGAGPGKMHRPKPPGIDDSTDEIHARIQELKREKVHPVAEKMSEASEEPGVYLLNRAREYERRTFGAALDEDDGA